MSNGATQKLKQMIFDKPCSDNPRQNNWSKVKKSRKIGPEF